MMYHFQHSDMVIDENMNKVQCSIMSTSDLENNRKRYTEDCVRSDKLPKFVEATSSRLIPSNTGHDVILKKPVKMTGDEEKSDAQRFTRLKSTEQEPVQENCEPTKVAETVENGDTVHCKIDVEEREDTINSETVHKRVCLVKLYAWLKEEISKTGACAVANHLYQHKARLLSRADHESINCSKWRRETVEMLLKKVLMGPDDINEAFITALRAQEEDHIIDKLEQTHVTEEEIELFTLLEQSSLNRCSRPDHDHPRFKISNSDNETLLFYLNNKNTIDSVNDQFLSKFYFSIREHTNICVCSMDSEGRVKTLINTMKLCADKIFPDFCDILNLIEMGHVISKLERRSEGSTACKQRQKRKSSGSLEGTSESEELSSSTLAKRQCVDPSIEYRLVSSMQRSASNLRLHSLEQFGFDVEAVNKGSIVIQLSPQTPDSWKRLEENCLSGKIKDFIPKVYDNADIYDMLKEGEYSLQFTIYTLPSPPDTKEEKKVMFHLETETDSKKADPTSCTKSSPGDNHIEEHMDLLCEEMEISKDLLSLLKNEKLVEDNIKDEMDKQGSRTKKIKFLLKKVASHGSKGYEILKGYIRENNEDLYQELVNREEMKTLSDSKLEEAAKVTKRSKSSSTSKSANRKEVFFSGTVILKVFKPETDPKSKEKTAKPKVEITCTEIVDPVCHFLTNDEIKDAPKSGEITMVLEDSWTPVGSQESPKREILVGKRKTRDKKADTAGQGPLKRYHSTEEHTSEEESSQDLASDLKESKMGESQGNKETVKIDKTDKKSEIKESVSVKK